MTHTKTLTRRSVTAGLAAALTAVPSVGLCKGASDASELHSLIEAHRVAWAAFEVEVEWDMREQVRDSYHTAFDAQEELFLEICSYRCSTAGQYRLKGEYLLSCSTVQDFWVDDAAPGVMELLQSLTDKAAIA